MDEFRDRLKCVDRSYEDFVHAVMSYVKIPGNEYKRFLIEEYMDLNPEADSSDILTFMIDNTDFFSDIPSDRNVYSLAV